MNEDALLSRVAVEALLARLCERDRAMVEILFAIDVPDDWPTGEPITHATVARYIGLKYEGRVRGESVSRYRLGCILDALREGTGPVVPRRTRRANKGGGGG